MNLETPLKYIVGIGPTLAQKLARLNLYTINDLINHYPFRYDDFSNTTNVLEAQIGEKVTLTGEIWSIKNIYTRSRKILTQAIFNDGTSPIELTWFNQSWLTNQIKVGDRLQVSGKVSKYKNKISIMAPIWERIDSGGTTASSPRSSSGEAGQNDGINNSLHTGRLVPVYAETFGLTSKWIRTKIDQILPQIKDQIIDPLPDEIKNDMIDLPLALSKIHFPDDLKDVTLASQRLGFDELFFIQLATQKARLEWKNKPSIEKLKVKTEMLKEFIDKLPFKLTKAQLRVIDETLKDLAKAQPMNRLIQGEVGSGKTVVAAVIAYIIYTNKLKTLFMAPTEILAFQHYSTFSKLLEPFDISVGIYTGSKKFTKKPKNVILTNDVRPESSLDPGVPARPAGGAKLPRMTGEPDVIVGTHALLSDKLLPENVGLIIVDEQQRFGVEQRTVLRNKAKVRHFLTMTATPIPRTVALTLYGDLDLSIIDELPVGRIPVKTHVVPNKKRPDAYKFIENHVNSGEQVFVVTPLIEFSETLQSAKAAKVEYERLKREIFPNLKLGLLHGKLSSKDKEHVINDFKDKEIDILVSTSVVEVGVDVPNASIMVIEGADRFGLSQLHQLRGRVGRGKIQSYCLLFPTNHDAQTVSRLKHLEQTNDGLKLAELDLKIRGSGEIFGTKQSGRFELKIASFQDLSLIEKTRSSAKKILDQDPRLEKHPQLKLKLDNLTKAVMPD